MSPLDGETVAELWRHARALAELGSREHSPPHARRALVTLAVAGSGGDAAGFEEEVVAVHRSLRLLGLDPVPLFDAASALLGEDDHAARSVMITLPRREAPRPAAPRYRDQGTSGPTEEHSRGHGTTPHSDEARAR